MTDECPSCGKDAVISEGFDGLSGEESGQRVCSACGLVLSEGDFKSDPIGTVGTSMAPAGGIAYNSNLPTQLITRNTKGSPQLRKFHDRVKEAAAFFHLSQKMTNDACELFTRVYNHRGFKACGKSLLPTACVYIICRQGRWPLMLSAAASLIEGTVPVGEKGDLVHKLGACVKRVQQAMNIDLEVQDITDIAASVCANVDDPTLETTKEILLLCKDLWIVDGRNPTFVITAACYFAWQAQNFGPRRKVSLQKFCKTNRLLCNRSVSNRAREMRDILTQLAGEIPWLIGSSAVDPAHVSIHVKDILKYRNTLYHDALLRMRKEVDRNEIVQSDGESVVSPADQEQLSDSGELLETLEHQKRPHDFTSPPAMSLVRKKPRNSGPSVSETFMPLSSSLDDPVLRDRDLLGSSISEYVITDSELEQHK